MWQNSFRMRNSNFFFKQRVLLMSPKTNEANFRLVQLKHEKLVLMFIFSIPFWFKVIILIFKFREFKLWILNTLRYSKLLHIQYCQVYDFLFHKTRILWREKKDHLKILFSRVKGRSLYIKLFSCLPYNCKKIFVLLLFSDIFSCKSWLCKLRSNLQIDTLNCYLLSSKFK